jgi:pimeloyl-ACP methyl ester carboxylesterase
MLWTPWAPQAYQRILAGTMGQAAVRDYPNLVRATYRATHRSGYARTVSSELRELFRGVDAEPPRYALRDDELRTIARPVLVIWGEGDTRLQAVTDARTRAALMPHSRFEVMAGEHTPWLDDPAACASRIATPNAC